MPVFDAATSHLFVLNHCHWLKGLQNNAQSLTLVKHLNRECVASHSRFPSLITLLVNVHSSKETCLFRQVSISSAERMLKEGGKPGERAPSKKGKEKGKEAKEVSSATIDKPCFCFLVKFTGITYPDIMQFSYLLQGRAVKW